MNGHLATQLRNGTQQTQATTDHSGPMKSFVKGAIPEDSFCRLLGNLYYLYSHLEAELECHKDYYLIQPLYFPELNRKANLENGLTYYYGRSWRQQVFPTPGTQACISRIREVSAIEPALLIPHAYIRYMGDLFGGQLLQRIAESIFGLEERQGTNFYDFEQISDSHAFKGKYCHALNNLPIEPDLANQMVAEAVTAFQLNLRMLRELGEDPALAMNYRGDSLDL